MRWQDINQQIARCRGLSSPEEVLECLQKLFEYTQDGMVAYAIGEEYESRGLYEEAEHWYSVARERFPLPQFKMRAQAGLDRVRSRREGSKWAAGEAGGGPPGLRECDPSKTLLIVSCTRTKVWSMDPEAPPYVPAQFAYCGPEFKRFVRWLEDNSIESRGFRWLILSARYGYLEPWQPIADYDVTFDDPQSGPISDETLYSQVMFQKRWRGQVSLRDFRTIFYVGGAAYAERIRRSFRDVPATIDPLSLEQAPSECC
ncbi:MAG: hypothetical protein QHH27_03255 [Clostridia bacterium]|nr:hypothetical protein [Clostridia bacterium]MDH7572554.1 hypothetical protein [Clostridia bacterium]